MQQELNSIRVELPGMNRLERCLFPRNDILNFFIIVALSGALSFLLIGRQIYQANWGMIDDHEVFNFLGPDLHLSLSQVWSTLLAKTEVGSLQGRFRPSLYFIKLVETSLWGANVHIWYLANTISFATFLGSIWWMLRRFAGGWLGGALTISISLLSLWADVWSRLGPSEIYGAACLGIMFFTTDLILFSEHSRTRIASAITLALATIVLIGLKETFIPLAAGTAAVVLFAAYKRTLPLVLTGVLLLGIFLSLGGIVVIVSKQTLARGTDFYANSTSPWQTIKYGIIGLFDGVLRTWWLYVLPIVFFRTLDLIPRNSLRTWIWNSREAVALYGFLILMYAAQCALYRSSFPHNSRYDFPAMLLVPFTCCILVCEVSRKARERFTDITIEYAQLTAAAFLSFALAIAYLGKAPPLVGAVKANIRETNLFYNELQRLVAGAEKSPKSAIILDSFGPLSYEPVFALSAYLRALGTQNPISVRFHSDTKAKGALYDGLQQELARMEKANTGAFTPLSESLANNPQGCLSVGIDGPADTACAGFQIHSVAGKTD